MTDSSFTGFSPECIDFYRELAENNRREWFEEHRSDFEQYVMRPARDLVLALGDGLVKTRPGIQADPRVNKSLFRIQRDIRFSRDKSPYKTHLAVWLWEGMGKRMECPGFYVHLEPGMFMIGAGLHDFPGHLLGAYREWAVHPKTGPALAKAVDAVRKAGPYEIGGRHYKKTPRGYDSSHPNAEYLLYNGLYAYYETAGTPDIVFSSDLVDFTLEHFRNMMPLHEWLLALTEGVS